MHAARGAWRVASTLPFPTEHFRRWARLVNVIVGGAPLDVQVAAGQMDQDLSLGSADDDAGNADGAGTRAAGPGDATAALPGSHLDLARRDDLHPMRVDASGEGRMP